MGELHSSVQRLFKQTVANTRRHDINAHIKDLAHLQAYSSIYRWRHVGKGRQTQDRQSSDLPEVVSTALLKKENNKNVCPNPTQLYF